MNIEQNKATARRFLTDIWSKGDLAVSEEILSPDFVFTLGVPPYRIEGTEAFNQLVIRNRMAFEGLTYTPDEDGIVAEGNRVVTPWSMHARHVGPWAGYTASNKNVSIKGMTAYRFVDGKIAAAEVQNEALSLVRQVGGIPPAGGPDYPEFKTLEANKAHMRRYVEVLLNQRDFSQYDELASRDWKAHRNGRVISGYDGFQRQMDMLHGAFAGLRFEIADMVADADKVAVLFRAPGTHTGEFAGIQPTGREVVWEGVILYRLAEGKVVETWAYWNDAELVAELRNAREEQYRSRTG